MIQTCQIPYNPKITMKKIKALNIGIRAPGMYALSKFDCYFKRIV
jgi:hypothetical protein